MAKINCGANLKKEIESYFCIMQSTDFILSGSNLGDRMKMLLNAEELLNLHAGEIELTSSVYETAAWGNTDQSSFLNKVVKLTTSHSPDTLLTILLGIEERLGRIRKEKWGPRTIDLDILYFDKTIVNTTQLVVPHPEIPNRRFTLVPLCEIAEEYIHPVMKLSNKALLQQCKDLSDVTIYNLS